MSTHARRIYAVLIVFLAAGALSWTWWWITHDFQPLKNYLRFTGAAFLIAISSWEAYLSCTAMNCFQPDEPLHRTWLFITISALCRLSGWSIRHVITPHWATLGDVIAGPVAMVLLSLGLLRVLRGYRQLGYGRILSAIDYAAVIAVGAYVVIIAGIVSAHLMAGTMRVDPLAALSWATDPLLCILLIQVVILRRMVFRMGGGLIARCWTSYVAAILLTTAGNVSQWLVSYQVIPWPYSSLTWFIWYPAAAAYAIGAAYQVEAIQRVRAWVWQGAERMAT